MTPALPLLIACVACIPFLGCGDGIGVPIRRAPLEQDAAADARADADDLHDEDDDASTREGPGAPSAEEHCAETVVWPAGFAQAEGELLAAINELRQHRILCADGERDGLEPLQLSTELRCSARLHSLDMARRDFTGRTNPDGARPGTRIRAAGFYADEWDESIASEESEPANVLENLLDNSDDCLNVATGDLTHVGIGRYDDRWTLDFARE